MIPPPNSHSYDKMLSFIAIKHPEIVNPSALHKIKHSDLEEELVNYEDRTTVKNYKFGLLYMKPGQSSENELFSNGIVLIFGTYDIMDFQYREADSSLSGYKSPTRRVPSFYWR